MNKHYYIDIVGQADPTKACTNCGNETAYCVKITTELGTQINYRCAECIVTNMKGDLQQ